MAVIPFGFFEQIFLTVEPGNILAVLKEVAELCLIIGKTKASCPQDIPHPERNTGLDVGDCKVEVDLTCIKNFWHLGPVIDAAPEFNFEKVCWLATGIKGYRKLF